MQKKCVLCLKDYFREIYQGEGVYIEAGELLNLDAGKIYNDDTYWICDLYSDEGMEHFLLIEDYNDKNTLNANELERSIWSVTKESMKESKGLDKLNNNVLSNIYNYSMEENRYLDFNNETILESIDACNYWLNQDKLPDDLTRIELILDLCWLSMVLLDREIESY